MDFDLTGKRMLVTGGCGFMGSNFIRRILDEYPEIQVTNLDLLTYAGNEENLDGVDADRYIFVRGDIADASLTKKLAASADCLINFAAETHVDRSIHEDAAAFVRTNVVGVQSLLEATRANPSVQRFVHISTDEVYGDLPIESEDRFMENSPFRPNSPYAASKAAGDLLIRAYVKTYGVPALVTHSVNNYGPRQYPEKLIPYFTARAVAGQALPLYGNGKNMRDWIYVDDHSDAVITALTKGEAGEVYNISQQKEYANVDIAKKILDTLGKSYDLLAFVEDRPAHDRKYAVDSSKMRKLGWKPQHSLTEKLPETVRWLAEHGANASANKHIRV